MGVKSDGKTAVFLVSSASGTTGEGNCEPDDTCTFLYMKKDQQQSFEAVDENDQVVTYVLKLLKINVEETEGAREQQLQLELQQASSRAARRAARQRRACRTGPRTGLRRARSSHRLLARRAHRHRLAPVARGREVALAGWQRCASRPPGSPTAPAWWPSSRACPQASRWPRRTSTRTSRAASSATGGAAG